MFPLRSVMVAANVVRSTPARKTGCDEIVPGTGADESVPGTIARNTAKAAATTLNTMVIEWNTYQAGSVPIMLESQMSTALNTLVGAVNAQQTIEARLAALNTAQAALDLQLQYRLPAEVDLARSAVGRDRRSDARHVPSSGSHDDPAIPLAPAHSTPRTARA